MYYRMLDGKFVRTKSTVDQKKEFKEKRKASCWFISVVFDPKKTGKAKADQGTPAWAKGVKSDDEDGSPQKKKSKKA